MKVVFSTNDVHARDRLDYWREEASKAIVAHEFSTGLGRSFQGVIQRGLLGSWPVTILEGNEHSAQRTQRCLGRGCDDDVLLSVQLSGCLTMHQDGRDAALKKGDVIVVDPRRPFSVVVPSSVQCFLVKVPRWEMQARLGDIPLLTGRPVVGSNAIGALASSFLVMLASRVGELNKAMGDRVAQQALDLVALAFESEVVNGRAKLSSVRTTTLLRLKAIIEARLYEPDLKPGPAAEAAGISVRYANVLLAQEDMSLERFIMYRRLRHSHQALTDPAQNMRTVSDIAYSCGFSDVSHFARRFKAEFGCSPSECRPQTTPAANKCAMPALLRKNGTGPAGTDV